MTPMNNGIRLDDRFMPPQGMTEAELNDAMYHLTADADQAELLVESCDLDTADDMLNPGENLITEAVSAVKNRIDRTMTALVRVLNRYADDVKPYDFPSIGPDRKNALFAYKTVTFTFRDGQTVSILFHAPGSDPKKIKPTDTLVAYRWLLNRRDITAIVSPERGRDLNLQLMAKRIMQLVEKNSDKFKANNEKRQEQQEKLAALESEQAENNEAVDRLTQQNADLSGQVETADARIERLQARLAEIGEGDREGSGAGAESTGVQGGGDYTKAAAAKQGLELLRGGRGHRVEGIEYSKTANGTDVTVAGTKVGTVTGRLSKNAVADMLANTSIDNFVDTATNLTALLNEQASMPEGYRFEIDDDPANMKRRAKLIGWPDSYAGIKLVRPNDAEGGYSGNVSLRNGDLTTTSPAASLHLVNEAAGTQDEPETIKASNITQLANLVADRVSEAFASTSNDGTGKPAGTEAGDASQTPVAVEMDDLADMLPVDVTDVGDENVYFTKDGQRYYFKPTEADDYQVGELTAVPGARPEPEPEPADEATAGDNEATDDDAADPAEDDGEPAPQSAASALNALDSRLFRDVAHAIGTVRAIDRGDEPTMSRSAFTSSITNKLKTQMRNGNEEAVDAALRLLAEQGVGNGKPILAKRSSVWKATGHDMDYYVGLAADGGETPEPEPETTPSDPAENEGDSTPEENGEVNRISEALQGILQETDSGAAMDALESAMDDAEAAGIDIDNDPDVAAASDHVTALLEKEAA